MEVAPSHLSEAGVGDSTNPPPPPPPKPGKPAKKVGRAQSEVALPAADMPATTAKAVKEVTQAKSSSRSTKSSKQPGKRKAEKATSKSKRDESRAALSLQCPVTTVPHSPPSPILEEVESVHDSTGEDGGSLPPRQPRATAQAHSRSPHYNPLDGIPISSVGSALHSPVFTGRASSVASQSPTPVSPPRKWAAKTKHISPPRNKRRHGEIVILPKHHRDSSSRGLLHY